MERFGKVFNALRRKIYIVRHDVVSDQDVQCTMFLRFMIPDAGICCHNCSFAA